MDPHWGPKGFSVAQVWVSDLAGTTVVRADAITTVKSFVTDGEARVSATTADGTIITVRSKAGVSDAGEGYNEQAVLDEARVMAGELLNEIGKGEVRTDQFHIIIQYFDEAPTSREALPFRTSGS
jgi:hypothetical protein